jgi:hypothetical protein
MLGLPLIKNLLEHIPLLIFFGLLPVPLSLVGDLQGVVRCHIDDSGSLPGRSNPAIDPDVSLDFLKIVV